RVRRLALEALVAADAVTEALVVRTAGDADPQLRRLAMRAAATSRQRPLEHASEVLKKGATDPAPMVRIEAIRGESVRAKGSDTACAVATAAVADRDANVVLVAIDQLTACSSSADGIAALEQAAGDLARAGLPRSWHRPAHS